MDEDDGLMLNIASSNEGQASEGDRHGNKKKNWRERRLEQRQKKKDRWMKPHLFTNQSEEKAKQVQRSRPAHTPNDTGKTNAGEQKKNPASQKAHRFQIVSSLFRHNPDIPDIGEHKAAKKKEEPKEKLFSGNKFSDLNLSPYMISNLENNMKLSTLTSVQKAAIPALLDGNDAFVKSNTGSGKTLAYAVPVIHSLQTIEPQITRQDGPYAVILVPTRELALQSFEVLQKLVKPCQWVVPGIVTGGEKRKSEKARLRKGINVLVATPGRLLDHIEKTECLHLKKVRWIVLDEADRLLDMGFDKEVSAILTSIKKSLSGSPHKCQTVLLSATLTKGVESLVGVSLQKPVLVDITASEDGKEITQSDDAKRADPVASFKTPQNLQQFFIVVPSKLRLVTLAALLLWKYKDTEAGKIIVFFESRDSVDFYSDLFSSTLQDRSTGLKLKMLKLHGNMSQMERTEVFKSFAEVKHGILFCTDVAARGLDLPHVNWIIQYNTPGRPADYIHRVGRTARIGLKGSALVFLTPAEVEYLKTLDNHGISPKEMSVNQVLKSLIGSSTNEPSKKRTKNDKDHTAQEAATELQLKMEEYVLADKSHMQSAKTAFQSFVRSYATYPADLKHIFHVKNLHLGHVAKSFGLRDAPTDMFGKKEKDKPGKVKKRESEKKGMKRRLPVMEHSSEKSFSGPLPSKRRKKMGLKRKSSKKS